MKKMRVAVFVAMTLALLMVGGGVIRENVFAESITVLPPSTPAGLMDDIYDLLEEYLDEEYGQSATAALMQGFEANGAPSTVVYRPEGLESYLQLKFPGEVISLDESRIPALLLSYDIDYDAYREKIRTILTDELGFVAYNAEDDIDEYRLDFPEEKALGFPVEGVSVICRISYINMDFVCNSTFSDNYDLDEESKEILNDLTAALRKSRGTTIALAVSPIANLEEEIVDSEFEPYQRIGIHVSSAKLLNGGGLELFYRVSPTSEWIYFTGTQSRVYCSEYNTTDLRRAYLGEVCYDEKGENSIVSLSEGDVPTVPDTGFLFENIEGIKKIAVVVLPAILICGFVARFVIERKKQKVKFGKK